MTWVERAAHGGRWMGWCGLAATAIAASLAPLPWQLGFAVVAMGIVGMAHGASDLAIVTPMRRPLFLGLYALTCIICLLWWIADPAIALPAFLIASAIHFGMEDAPDGTMLERLARGASLVATPATLNQGGLSTILNLAGAPQAVLPTMVAGLAVAGAAAAVVVLVLGSIRRDGRLILGTLALLVLPPLVGFSVGFLVLHALPQTWARGQRLGCATMRNYLRLTAPVLISAIGLVGVVGLVLLRWDHSGIRSLFAGIAALAVPHLVVTPWFERAARPAEGPSIVVATR